MQKTMCKREPTFYGEIHVAPFKQKKTSHQSDVADVRETNMMVWIMLENRNRFVFAKLARRNEHELAVEHDFQERT